MEKVIGKAWWYEVEGVRIIVSYEHPTIFTRDFWKNKHTLELKVVSFEPDFQHYEPVYITVRRNEIDSAREKLVNDFIAKFYREKKSLRYFGNVFGSFP